MTFLVCGSEGEWALYNNVLDIYGASTKRRGSVHLVQGDTMFKEFAPQREVWAHFRFAGQNTGYGEGTNQRFIQVRDTSGRLLAGLYLDNIAFEDIFRFKMSYASNNSGGVGTDGTSFPYTSGDFIEVDFHITQTTTAIAYDTLTIDMYLNAQKRLTRTVTAGGAFTSIGQVFCSAAILGQSVGSWDDIFMQDVIITDNIPTVGMELATLIPGAVGFYSEWNNNYTNIDEAGYDALDVISTTTSLARESWLFNAPTFGLGDKIIYGVMLGTVAQTDLPGFISDFQPFLRMSATDYNGASIGANNITPDSFFTFYIQNPSTAAPWEFADLTGLEAGVQAI